MALHTALPIYKVAYNLFDVVTDLVKNMPRDFKSSIPCTLHPLRISRFIPAGHPPG